MAWHEEQMITLEQRYLRAREEKLWLHNSTPSDHLQFDCLLETLPLERITREQLGVRGTKESNKEIRILSYTTDLTFSKTFCQTCLQSMMMMMATKMKMMATKQPIRIRVLLSSTLWTGLSPEEGIQRSFRVKKHHAGEKDLVALLTLLCLSTKAWKSEVEWKWSAGGLTWLGVGRSAGLAGCVVHRCIWKSKWGQFMCIVHE